MHVCMYNYCRLCYGQYPASDVPRTRFVSQYRLVGRYVTSHEEIEVQM